MSSAGVLALSVAGAAGGICWFSLGFRRLKRRRLLLNTPRSEIRAASPGRVEVSGLAAGPGVITSPLRKAKCFYYRSLAWELREGKDRGWVKIADETLHTPFWLDDGTGKLLVDPRGAEIYVACDWKEEWSGAPGMPEDAHQFLSRNGADFARRLRVEEYSIQPKNFLFVLGTLAENPVNPPDSPDAAAGAAPASESQAEVRPGTGGAAAGPGAGRPVLNDCEIVYLSPETAPQSATEMTQQQRLASALLKAGIGNPAAWDRAGVTPQSPAEGPAPNAADKKADPGPGAGGFDPHPPVVLTKGPHDSPFLISSRSPRDLARSLGFKSALLIWGGPILTLVSLSILLARYHPW